MNGSISFTCTINLPYLPFLPSFHSLLDLFLSPLSVIVCKIGFGSNHPSRCQWLPSLYGFITLLMFNHYCLFVVFSRMIRPVIQQPTGVSPQADGESRGCVGKRLQEKRQSVACQYPCHFFRRGGDYGGDLLAFIDLPPKLIMKLEIKMSSSFQEGVGFGLLQIYNRRIA